MACLAQGHAQGCSVAVALFEGSRPPVTVPITLSRPKPARLPSCFRLLHVASTYLPISYTCLRPHRHPPLPVPPFADLDAIVKYRLTAYLRFDISLRVCKHAVPEPDITSGPILAHRRRHEQRHPPSPAVVRYERLRDGTRVLWTALLTLLCNRLLKVLRHVEGGQALREHELAHIQP